MTTDRSGAHRIDREELRRLREEIDAALPPIRPRAKPLTQHREPKNTQHGEFLAAFGALTRDGWTIRAIARHLGVSHRYILDMRSGARPARTMGCDWIARLWSLLGEEVELPSAGMCG